MTPNELLRFARDDVGVAMGSRHGRQWIGWTTSGEKARRLAQAGAQVTSYGEGFEVVIRVVNRRRRRTRQQQQRVSGAPVTTTEGVICGGTIANDRPKRPRA
jgi:hypothetical protein